MYVKFSKSQNGPPLTRPVTARALERSWSKANLRVPLGRRGQVSAQHHLALSDTGREGNTRSPEREAVRLVLSPTKTRCQRLLLERLWLMGGHRYPHPTPLTGCVSDLG